MIGTDVLADQISVLWLLWNSMEPRDRCLYSTKWFHLDHKASLYWQMLSRGCKFYNHQGGALKYWPET